LYTLSWLRDISISVLIAVIVIPIFYRPVKVEGTSMMPLLKDQDGIFINQFVYNFSDVSRGDLIVFRYPGDPSKSYIKRVIALEGDSVEVLGGSLYLNGELQSEPYVPAQYRDRLSMPRMKVPKNEFFVMGDHRASSNDSRNWGTVHRRYIFGRAVFAYWPINRIGILP
jgi:signal peptidase I